jgi:glycolate dehydrogenase iron-sulfur subunit
MTTDVEPQPNAETPLPIVGSSIPYERFLDCVHCGLCTSSCPTYVETGDENDSPRGRIYLMRSVVDGRIELSDRVQRHLDLCLDCRSCETACPSGVQYGRLIEPFRAESAMAGQSGEVGTRSAAPDWFHRWIVFGLFPNRARMALALAPARLMQVLKIDRLVKRVGLLRLLPSQLRRMVEQLPQLRKSLPQLPEFAPAVGPRRARVGLFTGCVADAMFRHVHWATIRVLQQNGCDVVIPRTQGCCGAIHYHGGAADPALQLMQTNRRAFDLSSLDAVVVNVAGCGAMLKDYQHIHDELSKNDDDPHPYAAFVQKVRDVHEFLAELGLKKPEGTISARAVLQDACHLQHAQQIKQQPRDLLSVIPGLSLTEISEPELCCGAAGSYNLSQPEMADRLGERKIQHILHGKPDVIVTGNAGCSLQLQAQLKKYNRHIPVMHPMELLDLSYRRLDLQSADK